MVVLFISFILFFTLESLHASSPLLISSRSVSLSEKLNSHQASRHELFLSDPKKLVSPDFDIPKELLEPVTFWFLIYTEYSSQQVVFHHRDRPLLILDVFDVGTLRDAARSAAIAARRGLIESTLLELSKSPNGACPKPPANEFCTTLLDNLKRSDTKIPNSAKARSEYFLELKASLRSQSGQKDFINTGLTHLYPFEVKLTQIFQLFDVPGELLALAFLESSFNTRARSRVGAAGVWQFIRTTGSQFFVISQRQDDRINPLVSTLGALQLLKQNHKTLGRWDLAIWSYNSGMRHVLDARKFWKKEEFDLVYFLNNYNNPRIGFASRSFYPSFLALVYALAYKKDIYFNRDMTPVSPFITIDRDNLHFYVFLCQTKPNFIFNALSTTSPDLRELNTHLLARYHNTNFPRGTIFVSDRPLTDRRYFKVPPENYTNRYPKNWLRLLGSRNCQN
jgi:membrane-bound lytic murein transglycosylase D